MVSLLFQKIASARKFGCWKGVGLLAAILAPGRRHNAPHLAARFQRSELIAGLMTELEQLDPIAMGVSDRRSRADEKREDGEQHERKALAAIGRAGGRDRCGVCERGHRGALGWDE